MIRSKSKTAPFVLRHLFVIRHSCFVIFPRLICDCLAAPPGVCHDHNMKQFFLALLLPGFLAAETAQLTDQLGRTVLYGDIALSPDGTNVAWVQSTAATTSKYAYIQRTLGNTPVAMVDTGTAGERIDSDPAWSPDSKTLAVLSTAGEKDQKQLWTVNADGSDPKKLTKLAGYAARPR